MPQKFYITTAIHYVNDVPHIGHMYENIVADVIARHRRRMGDDVWFLTGTDEHGQRIERSAAKQGILPLERAREQNYFFRLSRYQRPLLDFYKQNPRFVLPQTRFNEVIAFVEGGLRDLSVSRTTIRWGVPWPGNPDHVTYVWLDALTNYISALGFGSKEDEKFERYWPA